MSTVLVKHCSYRQALYVDQGNLSCGYGLSLPLSLPSLPLRFARSIIDAAWLLIGFKGFKVPDYSNVNFVLNSHTSCNSNLYVNHMRSLFCLLLAFGPVSCQQYFVAIYFVELLRCIHLFIS